MREAVYDEIQHVFVAQGVQNVLSVALAIDDVVRPQYAEALRDGRDGFAFGRREFSDTRGTMCQLRQTRGFSHGPEDARATLEASQIWSVASPWLAGVIVGFACGLDAGLSHKPRVHTVAYLCKCNFVIFEFLLAEKGSRPEFLALDSGLVWHTKYR